MRKLRLMLALAGVLVAAAAFAAVATADDDDDGDGNGGQPGFVTSQNPMLIGLNGSEVQKIITVGDDLPNGFQFEAIPDGISLFARSGDDDGDDVRRGGSDDDDGGRTFDLYINHETSTVAFRYALPTPTITNSENDFDNSQVSRLTLNRDAEVVDGEFAIDKTAGWHRLCSNYIASGREGFSRPILFTNEEATDWVDRDGTWLTTNPANTPGTEQLGLVVAYDIRNETFKPIYGMGRHNHENSVALRGYGHPVVLSGDDTFTAPASQLYLYTARNVNNLLADGYSPATQTTYSRNNQRLWAFKANDSADADSIIENDYGDLDAATGEKVSGQFIPVPENIAKGDQTGLENWSNTENVFQFIRVEDIAVDRSDRNVFYFADTGEPRALQHATDPATNRLSRGASGTQGPFPNGRIFKMVLDRRDPTKVLELSIVASADAGGYFQAGQSDAVAAGNAQPGQRGVHQEQPDHPGGPGQPQQHRGSDRGSNLEARPRFAGRARREPDRGRGGRSVPGRPVDRRASGTRSDRGIAERPTRLVGVERHRGRLFRPRTGMVLHDRPGPHALDSDRAGARPPADRERAGLDVQARRRTAARDQNPRRVAGAS